jgi:predicted enzyme related to lactoylglutathione lyase
VNRRIIQLLFAVAVILTTTRWSSAGPPTTPVPPPSAGEVVWYDLLTENGEAVIGFYSELFDWEMIAHRDGGWVIRHHGRLIGAISEIDGTDTELEEGFWLIGIAVSDVDAAVGTATALGGRVDLGPETLAGFARYAVVLDLEDAPVLLVDPEVELGDGPREGGFVWAELWSQDPSEAAAFYGEVIGYERRSIEVDGAPYLTLDTDGEHRLGLVAAPLPTIEPAWVPYVGVRYLDDTLERVARLGGVVVLEPHPELGNGAVALVADPTGAAFFVYELGGIGEVRE